MLAVWEQDIWNQCNFEFRPLLIELMMYQGGCKMIGVARSSQKISSAPPYPFTKLINTMQNLGSQSISFKLGQGTFVQLICRNNYVYILFIFFFINYIYIILYFVYIFYISLSGHLLRGAESYIGQFRSFCRLQLVLRFPVIRYPSIALCLIIIGIYIKSLLAW